MFKKLSWITLSMWIVSTIIATPSSSIAAQASLPPIQVVEISGEEPPPPGISKEVDFGFGGGGLYCTSLDAHRIAGSGFSPPLANGGFGLFIDCIDDLTNPVVIYFLGDVSGSTGKLLATKYVKPSSARNALVQVKLSRSFPYDSSSLSMIIAQDGGFPGKEGGEWLLVNSESLCRGSSDDAFTGLKVGENAYVIRPQGLDLLSDPNGSGTKLSSLPFATAVSVTGNPICGFDGLTYWQVAVGSITGWLAQGDLATDWLRNDGTNLGQKPMPCKGVLPSSLLVGQRAQIAVTDGTPANMRFWPEGTSTPFRTIPERTQVTIISDPDCGLNNRGEAVAYRLVQLDDGTKGWVVETTPNLHILVAA